MVGGVRVKVYHKVDIDCGVFSEVLEVLEKFFEVVGFRHAPCRRFVVVYVGVRCCSS